MKKKCEECHLMERKKQTEWLAKNGSYLDRFFVHIEEQGRSLQNFSPRDVCAEFFEFLKYEGALKDFKEFHKEDNSAKFRKALFNQHLRSKAAGLSD